MQFDRLLAIGKPIQRKTAQEYGPALDSYLDFAIKHQFPIEPNPDTLSFYVVYMNHYVGPFLTDKYLTEVVNQLEPYFQVCAKLGGTQWSLVRLQAAFEEKWNWQLVPQKVMMMMEPKMRTKHLEVQDIGVAVHPASVPVFRIIQTPSKATQYYMKYYIERKRPLLNYD